MYSNCLCYQVSCTIIHWCTTLKQDKCGISCCICLLSTFIFDPPCSQIKHIIYTMEQLPSQTSRDLLSEKGYRNGRFPCDNQGIHMIYILSSYCIVLSLPDTTAVTFSSSLAYSYSGTGNNFSVIA